MVMTKVIGGVRDCAKAPDMSVWLQAMRQIRREGETAQLLLFSLFEVNFAFTFWFR